MLPVEVIDIGEVPSTLKDVHETPDEHETLVVATVPKELAPVQYARLPIVGAEDVPMPR